MAPVLDPTSNFLVDVEIPRKTTSPLYPESTSFKSPSGDDAWGRGAGQNIALLQVAGLMSVLPTRIAPFFVG